VSKRELVRHLLCEAGQRGVTTAEFLAAGCGSRFGARVQELRRAGAVIDVERLRQGAYRYVLRDAPDQSVAKHVQIGAGCQLFSLPISPRNAILGWERS
jgi:hypothetical protein